MADKKELLETIKDFLENEANVQAVFVYGSVLTDYFTNESDIDLAILVEKKFSDVELFDLQSNLSLKVARDVNIVQVSNNISIILRNEIARKGKLLFTKDSNKSDLFLIKTPQFYEDFMFTHKELEENYIEINK